MLDAVNPLNLSVDRTLKRDEIDRDIHCALFDIKVDFTDVVVVVVVNIQIYHQQRSILLYCI